MAVSGCDQMKTIKENWLGILGYIAVVLFAGFLVYQIMKLATGG